MVTIVQKGESVLHTRASEVLLTDITTPVFKRILDDMRSALDAEEDGVAIAAPQIAVPLRIFVISPKAFKDPTHEHLVYINPIITNTSRTKKWIDEGCLSVRWWYGMTHRYEKATVEAYDEHGNKFTRGGSGLLAQIFQHEIDHLDGILFCDHAKDLHKLEDKEIKKIEGSSNA